MHAMATASGDVPASPRGVASALTRSTADRFGGVGTPPAPPPPPVRLPPGVTEPLLAAGDRIARSMVERLATEIPLGGDYRSLPYLRLVLRACREGLRVLLRQLHDGRPPHPGELDALGRAGALQAERDVPLEVLLRGYRVAAKVVWRDVVDEAVRRGGLSPEMAITLGEQVLEYLDTVSGAVGQAYLETRERLRRQRDLERERALRRVLAGDAGAEARRLAAATGLELSPPYRVVAVAATPDVDEGRLATWWQRARALVAPPEDGALLALVDPAVDPRGLRRLARAAGVAVVMGVGPIAERLEDVGAAATAAATALRIGRRLRPQAVVHDHAELAAFAALDRDRPALLAHVGALLGPLLSPTAASLRATLDAVLDSRGPADAAARLGVHRHTVAYRLERIERLCGVDLEDPATRHRLWLALQLYRLLDEAEADAYVGVRRPASASASRASMKSRSEQRLR